MAVINSFPINTVPLPGIASQAEAVAGDDNTKTMTPLRVAQAMEQLSSDIVSQANVPIYSTKAAVGLLELPVGLTAFRVNGETSVGDGMDGLYVKRLSEPANTNKILATFADSTTAWFELIDQAVNVPGIQYPFAGSSARVGLLEKVLGYSESGPEFAGSFQLESGGGSTDKMGNFKVALSSVFSGLVGAADGWAANFVAASSVGQDPQTGLIGLEIDVNNNHIVSGGVNGTPYTAGLYITSAITVGRSDAAIIVAGAHNAWYDGLYFEDVSGVGDRLIEGASIHDNSKSRTVLLSTTSHSVGINFGAATFTDVAIITPGFTVGPAGDVAARRVAVAGDGTSSFSSPGFIVGPTGIILTTGINIGATLVRALAPPGSSTDVGTPGEYKHDASYIYVCTSDNNWKRVALSSY